MQPHLTTALREGPFHEALRAAIKARGLSLERLRTRLHAAGSPVGVATLSSWQSGRRRPERPESISAVGVLECILDVPSGSLITLLGTPRPRGPGPRSTTPSRRFADYIQLAEPDAALTQQLAWPDDRMRVISAWDQIHVTAGSCLASIETFLVLEAVEDVDRYVTAHHGVECPDPDRTFRFEALAHCRLGRVRRDPAHPLFVAELLFDRTIPAGDTALARFRITDTSGIPDTEFGRFARMSTPHVTVTVTFAPDARPQRCWRFQRERQGWPDRVHTEVQVGEQGEVHIARSPMPPGCLGIAWEPADHPPPAAGTDG
ncbi:hypothetical protein GCM10010123_45520 [Pilimelia anulata]|uniref:Uncharacterized protein n=1 Tax=Pilimelia anulata TaxID=53371 RepID=A0A8J3BC89_9ACTN|nr:hypothetical protein [Pilimelia anulata]GGK10453.1 hypothetical protein GCM10010123_45520 [Pilimelia anulata]